MLASFVEVWLAKEGHDGPVGVNLLTKIQLPNLAIAVRRDARRRGLRAHGRRDPARDPRRARCASRRTSRRRIRLDDRRASAEARRDRPALDPRRHWRGAAPTPLHRPRFLADHREQLARHHARAQGERPRRRLRDRGTDGGRPQRAAARRRCSSTIAASRSTASATWWTSRRSASSGCRSGWRAAPAPRAALREALDAGAAGHPGGDALRLSARSPGSRLSTSAAVLAHAARGDGGRVHRSRGVAHGLSLQGGAMAGRPAHTRPRRASGSATSGTSALRISGRTGGSAIAARRSRSQAYVEKGGGWRRPWAATACATR